MESKKFDLDSPVEKYASKNLVMISGESNVSDAARLMLEKKIGSLIVTRRNEPVGVVTERDILYKVVASKKNPSETPITSVMSSPIEGIEGSAKVGDAIAKMTRLGVRRLAVTKDGNLIGLVSQRSIVAEMGGEQILLPELESPKIKRCPYCDQEVKDIQELSRHIDMMHIGKGLLEGDVRKW